jgi:aminoglycoside phosphotransferase (APT) family kinase protein
MTAPYDPGDLGDLGDLAKLAREALPALRRPVTLEALSGGSLNQVVRLTDARGETLVLKRALPRVATAPEIALDPGRLGFEAAALQALAPRGDLPGVAVHGMRTPRLLAWLDHAHLLLLEDLGPCPDLAAEAMAGRLTDGQLAALGGFVGRLHGLSAARPEIAPRFDNADVQKTRDRVQYRGVRAFCEQAGLDDPAALGRRAEALGRRLLGPGRCLVMGDLWPRSVLVGDPQLYVIDWELAHWGNPLQDLAHLAAHLWIVARARGLDGQRWIDRFLSSYLEALGPLRRCLLDARLVVDCAVHFGAELLMRTVGPLRQGTPLQDLARDHPRVREALGAAARHLAAPERSGTFARLAT